MMYAFDQRIVFYHVPKTAGASIAAWIENNRNGHTAYIRPMHMLPKDFKKYNFPVNWSFCVVRNPWERWVSWWYFWRFLVKRFDTSFEEYTEKYFTAQYKEVSKQGAQYGENIPQFHYSRNVHQVLRYENLEEDFKQVQDKFNCYAPLEKIANVSKDKLHYSHYYTSPRLVDLVSDYYKQDITELGYKYEF